MVRIRRGNLGHGVVRPVARPVGVLPILDVVDGAKVQQWYQTSHPERKGRAHRGIIPSTACMTSAGGKLEVGLLCCWICVDTACQMFCFVVDDVDKQNSRTGLAATSPSTCSVALAATSVYNDRWRYYALLIASKCTDFWVWPAWKCSWSSKGCWLWMETGFSCNLGLWIWEHSGERLLVASRWCLCGSPSATKTCLCYVGAWYRQSFCSVSRHWNRVLWMCASRSTCARVVWRRARGGYSVWFFIQKTCVGVWCGVNVGNEVGCNQVGTWRPSLEVIPPGRMVVPSRWRFFENFKTFFDLYAFLESHLWNPASWACDFSSIFWGHFALQPSGLPGLASLWTHHQKFVAPQMPGRTGKGRNRYIRWLA